MITRAIITHLNGNQCTVRVPLFENDNSAFAPQLSEVAMMIPPGMLDSYKVGDVVILGFEENRYSKPIVLGKLFTGKDTNQIIPEQLVLLGSTKVLADGQSPDRANIANAKTLMEILNLISALNIRVSELENKQN